MKVGSDQHVAELRDALVNVSYNAFAFLLFYSNFFVEMCIFIALVVNGEQFLHKTRMRLEGFSRFALLSNRINRHANHEFFCRSFPVILASQC